MFTHQSPQKLRILREYALIESAISSNRIEGINVDRSRINTLILGKPLLKDRDEEEVRGYRDALAKKGVIPLKRGNKEGNKRRMAQSPDEKTYVEIPFIEQLKAMGWEHIDGDIDVPYLTEREQRRAIALDIHKILRPAATDLEKKNNEVQIVCKGRLVKGDSLWVEYRGETLPIDFIFGTPIKQEIRGFPIYTVSFNLSS